MHLALQIEHDGGAFPESKPLQEIGNICNILDRQLLKRFIEELTLLVHAQPMKVKDRHVLGYYVPRWLRGFFFDPNRSRRSYSTSWIIGKCFEHVIEEHLQPDSEFYTLSPFFVPERLGGGRLSFGDIVVRDIAVDGISDASRFLERVRNGSARNDLLRFLGNLSEIHWLDVYTGRWAQIQLANEIVHWVCTTLVSQLEFPLTKPYHLITI
jgi:hypothetical protein